MPLIHVTNEYTIPRGRVYFNRLDAAGQPTGELALGNCPGFTFAADTEKADHFSSEGGLAEKDASLIVKVNRSGKLTCDNFNTSNLALFVSGSSETQVQAAGPVVDEMHTVTPGRIYQLGEGDAAPAGVRHITTVTVKNGATALVLGTDYVLDLDMGRLQILAGSTVPPLTELAVSYTTTAKSWVRVKSGSTAEVSGSLRVVADNASGSNRDWYMPKVTLTPSGDLPVIQEGTDFTTMEFGVEVLKSANREALYIDGRAAA